jgi:hypothetical protein
MMGGKRPGRWRIDPIGWCRSSVPRVTKRSVGQRPGLFSSIVGSEYVSFLEPDTIQMFCIVSGDL